MWKPNKDIVWRSKEDMLVLLNTSSGLYFTLNQTGASLWLSLMDAGLTLDKAIEKITSEFDEAPDAAEIAKECEKLIEEWGMEELITEKVTE